MEETLKVYRVTSKTPIKNSGAFRSGLVFANTPEEAFRRMMDYLNNTKIASIYRNQEFYVKELPIDDSLVFEVEVDGGIPQIRVDTTKLKKQ